MPESKTKQSVATSGLSHLLIFARHLVGCFSGHRRLIRTSGFFPALTKNWMKKRITYSTLLNANLPKPKTIHPIPNATIVPLSVKNRNLYEATTTERASKAPQNQLKFLPQVQRVEVFNQILKQSQQFIYGGITSKIARQTINKVGM